MGRKFEEMQRTSERMGERDDCSVKALAITARVPYVTAHGVLEGLGRKKGGGAFTGWTVKAAQLLGCEVELMQTGKQPNGSRYTAKTIGKRFPRGYYLVSYRGHIAAMINGELEDWTHNRNHRVLEVYKVTVPKGSRS